MSVQAVNSVNNIQQKPVQSPIEPKKSEQKESIANGTTLLLGSLAALAVGAGIYFATKGRGGTKPTPAPNVNTPNINKNAQNIEKMINTDYIEDENLLNAVKNTNVEILNDGSICNFLRVCHNKLYKQYLKTLSKCKSKQELDMTIKEILTKEQRVDSRALNFVKQEDINMNKVFEDINKNHFDNKLIAPANAMSQEKMSILMSEYIKLAKQDLRQTINGYVTGIENFDALIKLVNQRLEWLK